MHFEHSFNGWYMIMEFSDLIVTSVGGIHIDFDD